MAIKDVVGSLQVEFTCPENGMLTRAHVNGKDFHITELAESYSGTIDFRCPLCGNIHTYEVE